MSEAEYLAFEEAAETKHEYVDGFVYDWPGYEFGPEGHAGASRTHNDLQVNLLVLLTPLARAAGCRAYGSDMRLRIRQRATRPDLQSRRYYYPDVQILCDQELRVDEGDDAMHITRPCTVFEILSQGSARLDHGEKRDVYLGMPSVQTYVLVHQTPPRVECYQRQPDLSWAPPVQLGLGDHLHLPCIESDVAVEGIYA